MHYIRFLKPPKLWNDASKGISVTLVVTIATDLGDDFFPGDIHLVIAIRHASSAAATLACQELVWRRGSRALTATVDLDASYDGAPFRVFVNSQDSAYEKIGMRNGALVMPCIFPVASPLIEPRRGKSQAEKLAVRTFILSNAPPISIYEDTGESIARHIWDAGAALTYCIGRGFRLAPPALRSLDRCIANVRGSVLNVIELGAGCGLVGIAFAAVVPNSNVLLTDVEDGTSRNIPASASNVSYCNLDWFHTLPETISNLRFDLIMAADCTYNPDSSPALVKTISRLQKKSKDALVLIASKTRHSSEVVFFELLKEEMFVQEAMVSVLAPSVYVDGECEDQESVDIYTFTKA